MCQHIRDDQAVLVALERLWTSALDEIARQTIYRVHVALLDLSAASERQIDWIADER